MRKDDTDRSGSRLDPAGPEDPWERARRWAIDWQLHLEESELRLEIERGRMRAAVLAETRERAAASGERGAE
jgi:hypothetical protein